MTVLGQRSFFVAALALAVMSYSPKLRADSKQAEAQALLEKTEKVSALTGTGSQPFELQLTMQYGAPARPTAATVFLAWKSENEWRVTAVDGRYRQIYLRNTNGLWRPKLPGPTLVSAFLYGTQFPFMGEVVRWDESIAGVRKLNIHGENTLCARLHRTHFDRELCVDPATGLLRRMSYEAKAGQGLATIQLAQTVIEYEDYAQYGTKWIPRTVRRLVNGNLETELHLVRLSYEPQMSAEDFADPDGPDYEQWQGCERYDYAYLESMDIRGMDLEHKVADSVYIIVNPDGKAREVRFINPTGRSEKQWHDLLMNERYRPASCDGTSVLGFVYLRLPLRR